MATNVTVEFNGSRFVVKVTPMMPLAAVAEDACRQAKVEFSKPDCTLSHAKKALDLGLPWRFANINPGAKLQLAVKDQPGRSLGFQDPADCAASSAASKQGTPAGQRLLGAHGRDGQHKQQPVSSARDLTSQNESVEYRMHGQSIQLLDSLEGIEKDVGRPFFLFSQQELAGQAGSTTETNDQYYEMTMEDYQTLMSAAKTKSAKDSRLMTKAMRDREEAAFAARLPPVRVRVVLAGQLILQSSFSATDKVEVLKAFVRKCLSPAARDIDWYLYSTPPKQVLENPDQTLFKAGLAPAAKLYFGMNNAVGAEIGPEKLLRDEVMAHQCSAAAVLEAAGEANQNQAGSEVVSSSEVASIPGVHVGTTAVAARDPGEKKQVPKWLKMSK